MPAPARRPPRRTRPARFLLLTALCAAGPLALSACSGAAAPASTVPTALQAAPEPARAPPPAATPAGRVVALGDGRPEGLVADPASGLVAVALRDPDRLALFDPASGTVVRTVPVPGGARHLALAARGGAVLLPGEDTDQLVTVAVPEGEVLSTVATGRQPHDVAVVQDGDRYVADEFGGSVTHLSGGAVVGRFDGMLQPGGAAGAGDVAAVVDVRGRQLHLFRGDVELPALPAGQGPTHVVAAGPTTLFVADTSGDAVLRYDVPPTSGAATPDAATPGQAGTPAPAVTSAVPREAGRTAVGGRPYGLAYDARRQLLYVTATARNLLLRFQVTPTGLVPDGTWPTVRDAYSVAVVPQTGQVVVAGESGSQLQVVDP